MATAHEIARRVFGPLFETSPHPMVVFDHLLRFVAVNGAYEDYVQRPRQELLGQLPDADRYRFPTQQGQLARLLMGTADGCVTEVEVLRTDGTTAWATAVGQAVRDGEILRYIGLQLTDVTAIRRAQRELTAQLEVSAVIRDATTKLASSAGPDVHSVLSELVEHLVDTAGLEAAVITWQERDSTALVAARAGAAAVVQLHHGDHCVIADDLTTADQLDTREVPGIDHWPSTILAVRRMSDLEPVGWFALAGADGTPPPVGTADALADFLDQARQRATRADEEQQHIRLQEFVNQTASDYLAHRFTGDRQEVLDSTLAGLARILEADNAQFRIVDWDRMVSAITAEFVADGHTETDEDFRVLDLNIELFRDIAAGTEPSTFEMAGMRGQDVSILNVPLVVEGVSTATLNAAGPSGRRWTDIEIEACRSVAGLMVQLQRRTELERTLANRLELGEMVKHVATEFNEARADAAESAIDEALGQLASALASPRIGLWQHDHDDGSATLDRVWQEGVGGFSLAGIMRIDVGAHADAEALFESTEARALTPSEIPTSFGDVPDDLHLLYVPVARNGHARLALSVESWVERAWSTAEVDAAQSVAQLISQLWARVGAERAMVRRLALEDVTRKVATDMLQLTTRTSLDGLHEAFGAVGEVLGVDRVTLWNLDQRDERLSIVTQWVGDERPGLTTGTRVGIDDSVRDLSATPRRVSTLDSATSSLSTLAGTVIAKPVASVDGVTTSFLVFEREGTTPWNGEDQQGLDVLGSLVAQLGARLQAETYFETAFANAPVGISLRDADGRLLACNPAFERFVGRAQDELLGTTVTSVLRPEYVDENADEREFRLRRPDGTHVWGRVHEARVRLSGEQGEELYLRHISDITATRQAVEQLEYQAGHDELTGLANRRLLMEQLRTCLQPVPCPTDAAILLLDIDRFKVVNDSLGHSTGDEVLRVIADRLRLAVRPQDVVCRLGGDEFVVLLRGPVSGVESTAVANRLLELLSDPIEVGSLKVFMSASIGIAYPTAEDRTLEDVLRHADAAMYMAKSKGRNRFEVFDQRHRDALAHRVELESELRLAIDGGELELHYQPEIALDSGELLGAEALVRWPHPRLGMMSAGRFIDVAEETGQVVELGRLVLDKACAQAAEWNRSQARPLTVRVNLSGQQLDRPELVGEVSRALERHGVHPEHMCLEITETAIMSDVDESLALLERLREVGVRLAIDDFGTGFSSLAYLKRFPVDVLKIDQAFVRGLGRDRDDEAIVRSVLSMADALDLEVVAEGIETTEQREMLLEMGCDRGQGFGLHRPAPVAELAPLLAAGGIDLELMTVAD